MDCLSDRNENQADSTRIHVQEGWKRKYYGGKKTGTRHMEESRARDSGSRKLKGIAVT